MSLNIKNQEAPRLARELAESTGDSMATAVTQAVRERLERVRQGRHTSKVERTLKIARECAPRWKEPFRRSQRPVL
jgi:antitoxin VapB